MLPRWILPVVELLRRHERLLWGVHSLWALALGVLVMRLGARNYAWLRVTLFYVAFLWATSLFVPSLVDDPRRATKWRGRLRLVINYFHKNFYQQLLFFLLPVYWASATVWSANVVFVFVLAVSALLSTLDIVYDRHLSVRRGLLAVFFGFNLFACINVMLPTLWSVSNQVALPLSAALAVVAFATIRFHQVTRRWRARLDVVLAGASLALLVAFGRPLIPPAPLRVLRSDIGTSFSRSAFQVTQPLESLTDGWSGRLYVMTSVYAPLGLSDRIAHRWYRDGRLIFAPAFYRVTGGRREGFRLWTSVTVKNVQAGSVVRVDVETEAGQLVGRAEIRAAGAEGGTGYNH